MGVVLYSRISRDCEFRDVNDNRSYDVLKKKHHKTDDAAWQIGDKLNPELLRF